jgi:phosphoenolpyruvate-protein kinase (PTS system EI component)
LLIDGSAGTIVLDPHNEKQPVQSTGSQATAPAEALPAGLPRVEANVNLLMEEAEALRQGADGIGLFRSEFLFLARRTVPTEEEQFAVYRKLVQGMAGRSVCIRTFDLRPDKLASYAHLGAAASKPLDWRVVLESQPLQQLFREQVRAILRAAAGGNALRILVPMVTRAEILDFARQTLERAKTELEREGLDHGRDVRMGVMIETAAAVPLVRMWADRVDFIALGTNDLTASALGVDRDDRAGVGGADPLHPGLLHLIDQVMRHARAAGCPVSVCGEMAADPFGAAALAALGVTALSVPVNQLAATRRALARLDATKLPSLRKRLLRQPTADAVWAVLRERDAVEEPRKK